MNKLQKEMLKEERVKCIYCGEEIHINKFAGMNKRGLFCNNILCLIRLIRETEEEKLKQELEEK